MPIFNRVSARRGQDVALDSTFYFGGQRTDPFAIYRIEIFRGSVSDSNIVDAVDIVDPTESSYPSPLIRQPDPSDINEQCPSPPDCDAETTAISDPSTGRFRLIWDVPTDVVVPDIYFDVWYYFTTDPGTTDLSTATAQLVKQCNRFWIYPDEWYVDGGLETIRFGFEPIDIKFKKPEKRPLEVGIMPLPLYNYNYNLVAPLIPFLDATISIWTEANEQVVSNEACVLKLRQGSFRSNPWVVSHDLDTCRFFKGTYKYRIKLNLPDGSSRVSGDYIFTVS